jgi:selenocysteine lyase/cysteine desulfurase
MSENYLDSSIFKSPSYKLALKTKVLKDDEFKAEIEFGSQVRSLFFRLNPSITFLNHGSYGAVPKPVYEKRRQLADELEAIPDEWFRWKSKTKWDDNIECLAEYLRINKEQLVLCQNATEAINSVLKSIHFDEGDAILETEFTYGAIKNSIDFTAKQHHQRPKVFNVNIKFPIHSSDSLISQFDQTCQQIIETNKYKLKLAVLDQISSTTAIFYPVEKIIKVIRKHFPECIILIDGAHAIGQINIDLEKIDCDFYVSNLHKWFFAPRGCAFLFVRKIENSAKGEPNSLQPNYISWGYTDNLSTNYFQRATLDNTSFFCIKECINVHENYFGGNIYNFVI